jgi:putative restriction endonuclease
MPESTDGSYAVKQELGRRINMWNSLLAAGGPKLAQPTLLRELGIYGGGQGIWVNKQRTGSLTDSGTGVTVGVLHTGRTYADDLSADGVLYHYPATNRPPGRDLSEIKATKAAGTLALPVFVIAYSDTNPGKRNVHLGWVEEWDDSLGLFLIAFSDDARSRQLLTKLEEPFQLTEKRKHVKREVKARPGQSHFSFYVFQRYGRRCAVCSLSVPEVLDAAHIVPDRHEGSYDPRNGMVLCAVHHRAFDAGLFAIEPSTLKLHYNASGLDADALKIDRETLKHLPRQPHEEALRWRWDRWQQ